MFYNSIVAVALLAATSLHSPAWAEDGSYVYRMKSEVIRADSPSGPDHYPSEPEDTPSGPGDGEVPVVQPTPETEPLAPFAFTSVTGATVSSMVVHEAFALTDAASGTATIRSSRGETEAEMRLCATSDCSDRGRLGWARSLQLEGEGYLQVRAIAGPRATQNEVRVDLAGVTSTWVVQSHGGMMFQCPEGPAMRAQASSGLSVLFCGWSTPPSMPTYTFERTTPYWHFETNLTDACGSYKARIKIVGELNTPTAIQVTGGSGTAGCAPTSVWPPDRWEALNPTSPLSGFIIVRNHGNQPVQNLYGLTQGITWTKVQ